MHTKEVWKLPLPTREYQPKQLL